MNIVPRVNVLGVEISATKMAGAVSTIQDWIELGERHYVCVTGVHGVMESQQDRNLQHIHNSSGLTVPDGMPMVWVGHIEGFSEMGRVYGPDLMLELFKVSEKNGYSHFLYGGDYGVAEELKRSLTLKFPGANIVGTFTPPFRPLSADEEKLLIDLVADLKPDIFWVGLSTPKQERFMAEYLPKLNTKVMIGVGAAFDIHSGKSSDAPTWVKQTGLQWLHRLLQEPKRLWKRFLINNPIFIYKIISQFLRKERSNSI